MAGRAGAARPRSQRQAAEAGGAQCRRQGGGQQQQQRQHWTTGTGALQPRQPASLVGLGSGAASATAVASLQQDAVRPRRVQAGAVGRAPQQRRVAAQCGGAPAARGGVKHHHIAHHRVCIAAAAQPHLAAD